MAVGLLAALTAVVSAFYFLIFVWGSAVLGAIAVVLGALALTRRSSQRTAALTGLIAGALAVVLSLAVGLFALTALSSDGAPAEADGSGGPRDAQEWGSDQETLLEWPANMATGGILFVEGMEPARSTPLSTRDTIAPHPVSRETGPADIRLYVDYRCPYCMQFEQVNGAVLEGLVRSGAATLEVIPLTFLDRASQGTAYSSRAAGAMACIVDGQPAAAWTAHTALLSPEVQPDEGSPGLSDTELITVLGAATGGLDAAVEECIENRRFVQFASAFGAWAGSNPVPDALDPTQQVEGTPFIVVNGVPYTGHPADADTFLAFIEGQGL